MSKGKDNKVGKVCFTLNNYSEAEYKAICAYAQKLCQFSVIGKEVGEEGTPHLQGYLNFVNKRRPRFSALTKQCPRAHFTLANGTDQQNLAYCTKTDKEAFIVGEPQTAGKRNDLSEACDKILAKKPLATVAVEHPETFVKYSRGMESLVKLMYTDRTVDDPPMTLWLWGPAGVGKTRYAYDNMPHEEIYVKDGTKWWDGYTQQQCILIDDFDGQWPFRDFLRLLDRFPYQGQYKGGYVKINSPIIIITCEHSPQHFWNDNELAQVSRRLTHVERMNAP